MGEIVFNFEQYDGQIAKSCMERIVKAAGVIAESARSKCKEGNISRPVSSKGKYAGQFWTERTPGAMRKTIRVVEKHGAAGFVSRDVRVIAGNKKTWWATQMEFGRGKWKGGAKPFLRPAMNGSKSEVQSIIENG
jgi:hypothetical protein